MITITERAAEQVRRFVREHGDGGAPQLGLRLRVTGGGCDGLSHELEIDGAVSPADARFEAHGITIVVDSESLPLVAGSEIDYVDGPDGAGFTVRCCSNPSVCGCGSAFRP